VRIKTPGGFGVHRYNVIPKKWESLTPSLCHPLSRRIRSTFAPAAAAMTIAAIPLQASANVVHYQITFPGTRLLPTSGSLDYDAGLTAFNNFVVNWDGLSLGFT
jgi:hypothetical protein